MRIAVLVIFFALGFWDFAAVNAHAEVTPVDLATALLDPPSVTALRIGKNETAEFLADKGQFRKLRHLEIQHVKPGELPSLEAFPALESLVLGWCGAALGGEHYPSFRRLRHLKMTSCALEDFVEALPYLDNLESLLIQYAPRLTAPDFSASVHLRTLTLKGNGLQVLAESFGVLSALEKLDVSTNEITAATGHFAKLHSLRELNAGSNRAPLPAELFLAPRLEVVLIAKTLPPIPATLSRFKHLKKLDLSNSAIGSTAFLGGMSIDDLNLSSNRITEVAGLRQVHSLNLKYNQLTRLPPGLFQIKNLGVLNVANNAVTEVTADIRKLGQLKELHFADNRLSTLPAAFANLRQLNVLDLLRNRITEFPKALLPIRSLENLSITGPAMPPSLSSMSGLLALNVENSEGGQLPADLPPKLQSLRIVISSSQRNRPSDAQEVPAAWARARKLERITLSGVRLETFPALICTLPALTHLTIDAAGISTFPEAPCASRLEVVQLSSNPFAELPAWVFTLDNLKELHLSYTKLVSLPTELGRLANLEVLRLGHTPLESLPTEVGQLQKLRVLDLSYSRLPLLPEGVGLLSSLQELGLRNNARLSTIESLGSLKLSALRLHHTPSLRALPDDLCTMQNLVSIEIFGSALEKLPACLADLPKLNELTVRNSKLTELPRFEKGSSLRKLSLTDNAIEELGELTGLELLESLELAGNRLQEIGAEIGRLSNLRILVADRNSIKHAAPELGALSHLGSLQLGKNQFSEFPVPPNAFLNLAFLDLSWNDLKSLSVSSGSSPKLTRLTLHSNTLRQLRGEFPLLTYLDLGDNNLTDLDDIQGPFPGLTHLVLTHNNITRLPENLCRWGTLEDLRLSENPLRRLPDSCIGAGIRKVRMDDLPKDAEWSTLISVLASMPELQELIARNNSLTEFPLELGNGAKLEKLVLTGNQIAELPQEWTPFPKLSALAIEKNGIAAVPDSLAELPALKQLYIESAYSDSMRDFRKRYPNLTVLSSPYTEW